jgi:gamma-butyrobetaine dioxygenase
MNALDTIHAVSLGENGLTLTLDGAAHYFNYYWLRDLCPSTKDPVTRERIFDITELHAPPTARGAHLDTDSLVVDWAGEDHQSRLPLDLLREVAITGRLPDPAALPRRLWYKDTYPEFVRVTQADVLGDPRARLALATALAVDGVALVTGMENSDDSLTRLVTSLGPVTPTVDGQYFDVRLHIDPTNLAYTANALEMHTDLPNEDAAPGIQFLHCRANSVEGGYSLFLDGAAVAEALREEAPEDFALLANHDVPFIRRHTKFDYRAHQRVIELDPEGRVTGVTISQHLQDVFDLPQTLLDSYYPAFCRFIRMMKEDRFVNRFRLNAGECIVFDNHRVVHGREAFVASSGERHLRGCYTDRGAMRSTLRVLSTQS